MSDTFDDNEIKNIEPENAEPEYNERENENLECYAGLLDEDPTARSLFYDRTIAQVASLCRKYNVPETDADQIFIDALTLTWAHIANGKYVFKGANPSTYMYQIAYYKIMEFCRKRGRNITKELKEGYDGAMDDFLDNESIRQAIFDKTFPFLSEDCQKIIMLVGEKMTDQEIADDPNVLNYNSRGGVNRKKNECREAMKELLRRAGYFD